MTISTPDGQMWPTGTDLRRRYAVVTGGSAGIGHAIVRELEAAGVSVLIGSRRPTRGSSAHRHLDLSSKASVADFASGLLRDGRPVDLLVLNAGVHVPWRHVTTADGLELHWQVNFLSNFQLAHHLLELCSNSTLKRVVYVASEAHRLAAAPGASLLGFWHRYAKSKEAAITGFLRFSEVHPELTVRIISPGYVDSEIHRHKTPFLARLERTWSHPREVQTVAREVLTCSDPSAGSSIYWDRGVPSAPARRCSDAARADALWLSSLAQLRDRLPDARPPQRVTNYARTFRAFGPAVERPETVDDLARIVEQAVAGGKGVRIVGRRHSYNDCFYSPACMVSLDRLNRIVAFEPDRGTITCEAGISIGTVARYLDERGFALRYCGNFGEQTLAGALATGTHGYGRDGGVISELVRAATVLCPDGRRIHTEDEADLAALRLSLGALGAVVELTLAIEPQGPCRFSVRCFPREDFALRLDELAAANEYFRFIPHPFDARAMLCVTINRVPEGTAVEQPRYIDDRPPHFLRALVPALQTPAVRAFVGRALSVSQHQFSLQVPFSSMLFISGGVVRNHETLARLGQLALTRHNWLNMEFAIPRARFAEFERLFAEVSPRVSRFSRSQPYYACRVAGAAHNVLLAPNHDRDVVFCDIHADPAQANSRAFLERLETLAIRHMAARPHWGKVSFAERDVVRALYPAANIAAFLEAKRRFDSSGAFSNAYTRRVLGV